MRKIKEALRPHSAKRSALVVEKKLGSMCGSAQMTFIVWMILLAVDIAMTAKVNGGCYLVLQRICLEGATVETVRNLVSTFR